MSTATINSMNFLIQKNDDRINAAIPTEMRRLIKKMCDQKKVNESVYIKMALQNQLERDLAETV